MPTIKRLPLIQFSNWFTGKAWSIVAYAILWSVYNICVVLCFICFVCWCIQFEFFFLFFFIYICIIYNWKLTGSHCASLTFVMHLMFTAHGLSTNNSQMMKIVSTNKSQNTFHFIHFVIAIKNVLFPLLSLSLFLAFSSLSFSIFWLDFVIVCNVHNYVINARANRKGMLTLYVLCILKLIFYVFLCLHFIWHLLLISSSMIIFYV